jgi:hypothetical protein
MTKELLSDVLVGLSLVALILAAVTVFTRDIWLASTQWMLAAIILAVYGCYLRLRK